MAAFKSRPCLSEPEPSTGHFRKSKQIRFTLKVASWYHNVRKSTKRWHPEYNFLNQVNDLHQALFTFIYCKRLKCPTFFKNLGEVGRSSRIYVAFEILLSVLFQDENKNKTKLTWWSSGLKNVPEGQLDFYTAKIITLLKQCWLLEWWSLDFSLQ